jgi:nitrogen fixation protein FixH
MSTTLASRGRYIPWLFVLGFALVVAVNGTMIWFAVGSFSGLYTPKPRDRGLRYNDVITAQQSRDILGWRIESRWQPESHRLDLTLLDRDGRPLTNAHATVELVRPTEKRPPLAIAMAIVGPGQLAGTVDLPARGNWDIDIVIERDGQRFAQTRRMFLQ